MLLYPRNLALSNTACRKSFGSYILALDANNEGDLDRMRRYNHAPLMTIPYVIFTSGLVLTADCAEQLGYASLSRPFFLPPQVGKGSGLQDCVSRT